MAVTIVRRSPERAVATALRRAAGVDSPRHAIRASLFHDFTSISSGNSKMLILDVTVVAERQSRECDGVRTVVNFAQS